MEFLMQPIGLIHSPFSNKEQTPIQAARSQALGRVQVYPEFVEGLEGLEEFSHIFLLYVFHASTSYALRVQPFLDDRLHGLFATRHPCRPNAIGLSVVRLLALKEDLLEIQGVDVLDDTPLLDIKPYVPDFDLRTDVRVGWYEKRSRA